MQDSDKPGELPGNPPDRLSDHEMPQSSGNEKSGSTQQDATVDIGQPGGKARTEGDQKKKKGGYGYYLVSNGSS